MFPSRRQSLKKDCFVLCIYSIICFNGYVPEINARNESLGIKKCHFSEFEIFCTDLKIVVTSVTKIEQWSYNIFLINIAFFEMMTSLTLSSDFDASVYNN